MQAVHRTLLEVNEDFLVSEAPAAPLLQALLEKRVLTDLDLQQLSSLEPQGARAVKRFVLHVLPLRGPLAYPALLEALQEARAQHLVDLLLEGEAVLNAAVKPIELPEIPPPPKPPEDPNEYARKLRANRQLIEQAVDPQHLTPFLLQNAVLSPLEEALLNTVQGQHDLTWSVLWGVLLQRGLKAYKAFMGALLHNGYSALFHTIEETKVSGAEAMKMTLNRHTVSTDSSQPAADDPRNDTSSILLRSDRRPEAHPILGSSRQFAVSARHHDVVSGGVSQHPHAGPLRPGYSLGDLEFLHTPRSEHQGNSSGAPDPAPMSSSVDVLYSPAWADPYNHLRGTDVASPQGAGFLYGVQENGSAPSLTDPGYSSTDQNHGGKMNGYEQPASTENADGQRDTVPLTTLQAISEHDGESDRSSHVDEDKTAKLSSEDTQDQPAENSEKDPESTKASPPPERSRDHQSPPPERSRDHQSPPPERSRDHQSPQADLN